MTKSQAVSAGQILDLISEEELKIFGEVTQVDKGVKKLYGRLIFTLLVYTHLKCKYLSTRILEQIYNSKPFEFLVDKDGHQTRHSSIADRIKTINPDYFQIIFNSLKGKLFQGEENIRAKNSVLRMDSTMIRIGAGLVEWGMSIGKKPKEGKGYKQLKLTVSLYNDFPVRAKIHHTKEYLSEDMALGEAVLEAGTESILLFDRGLVKRSIFDQLCDKESRFVTRGKEKTRLVDAENHSDVAGKVSGNLTFISDEKGKLESTNHKKTKHIFRLIKAVNEDGKEVSFLTNIMDLSAEQIAEIYKKRWDIEIFFKFLKQEMNISRFVSHDLNGIKVMIYTALITACLLTLYKRANKLEGFKIPKFKFALELEDEITELLGRIRAAKILIQHGIDPKHAFE